MKKSLLVVAAALAIVVQSCAPEGADCLKGNWINEPLNCGQAKRFTFNSGGTGTFEFNNCDSLCTTDATLWYSQRSFLWSVSDDGILSLHYDTTSVNTCDGLVLPTQGHIDLAYLCKGDELTFGNEAYKRE